MTALRPDLRKQWTAKMKHFTNTIPLKVSLRRSSTRKALYMYFNNRGQFLRWLREHQDDISRIVKVTRTMNTGFTRVELVREFAKEYLQGE